MTPIAPLVTSFLRDWLPAHRGASRHTVDSYSYALRLLFLFASERLKIPPSAIALEQLDPPMVLDFLVHLEADRGNHAASRNGRLAAIKSFLRYVEPRVPSALEQVRRILAIPAKKTESRLVRHLTREQVQALLDAPDTSTRWGLRDRALLHLAFAAGLRASELLGLRLDEVAVGPEPTIHVSGKGRRQRVLPIWKQTASALRAWLAVRGTSTTPEVFFNSRDEPMTRSGFAYLLDKYVAVASACCPTLKGRHVSPHVLRHSCAMAVLQATGDIRKVSLWLGHTTVRSTEVYTRVDPVEKLEALQAVVPIRLRRGHFTPPDRLIALLREGGKAPRRYAQSPLPPPGPERQDLA